MQLMFANPEDRFSRIAAHMSYISVYIIVSLLKIIIIKNQINIRDVRLIRYTIYLVAALLMMGLYEVTVLRDETAEVHLNGGHHIQNFHLGRFFVGYTCIVENHVLWPART